MQPESLKRKNSRTTSGRLVVFQTYTFVSDIGDIKKVINHVGAFAQA